MYIHYARQLYIIQSRILDQYIYVRFLLVVTVYYNSTDYYITNIVNRYYRQIDLCVQFSWADCTLYSRSSSSQYCRPWHYYLLLEKYTSIADCIEVPTDLNPISPRILYHSTIQRISDIDIISIDTHWIVLCTIGDISEIYTYIQSGLVHTGALI